MHSRSNLTAPRRPRVSDNRVVGYCLVEVQVRVAASAVEPGKLGVTLEHPARPGVLDSREVTGRPSSDIVEGGTDRVASCSAVSPSHFNSKVMR